MPPLFDTLERLRQSASVPEHNELFEVLLAVNRTLGNENDPVRPRDPGGMPGGMVLLRPDLPTVVLPDIHARPGLISSALAHRPDGQGGPTVLDLLSAGALQLVCVGDYFHGEGRVRQRWRSALAEFSDGFRKHEAMDSEMAESLAVVLMIATLKNAFPGLVHLLKGNHENVANESGAGNHPFGKYAYEGAMVLDYVRMVYDDRVLAGLYYFEKRLPLLAVGSHFLISHAEPTRFFSREEVVDYRNREEVVYGLTWTDDGQAESGAVSQMLQHYLPAEVAADALYFGGHRPVKGRYNLRAGGRYVQIHNPSRYIVAFLPPDRPPDPARDIFETGTPEDAEDGEDS